MRAAPTDRLCDLLLEAACLHVHGAANLGALEHGGERLLELGARHDPLGRLRDDPRHALVGEQALDEAAWCILIDGSLREHALDDAIVDDALHDLLRERACEDVLDRAVELGGEDGPARARSRRDRPSGEALDPDHRATITSHGASRMTSAAVSAPNSRPSAEW